MSDPTTNEAIYRASMIAYQSGVAEGRKLEANRFWRAIDLNSIFNDIGDYIYLEDLRDALKELENERNS